MISIPGCRIDRSCKVPVARIVDGTRIGQSQHYDGQCAVATRTAFGALCQSSKWARSRPRPSSGAVRSPPNADIGWVRFRALSGAHGSTPESRSCRGPRWGEIRHDLMPPWVWATHVQPETCSRWTATATTQSFRKISGLQVRRIAPTFPRLVRTGDARGALLVGGTGPILPILRPHSPAPFQKWAFQPDRPAGGSNSLRAGKSAVNCSPTSEIASSPAPAVPVRVKGS